MGITYNSAFVNHTAFHEIGVNPPEFTWSWEDARNLGIQVRHALDAQGRRNAWIFGDPSREFPPFRWFNRQRGREAFDADGNITFTIQDLEDWFNIWHDFRRLGIVPDAATSAETMNLSLENNLFAQRRQFVASYTPANQLWMFNSRILPNDDVRIHRQIGSRGNQYVGEFAGFGSYAVHSRSSRPRQVAATQLINFWLNDERSLALFQLDQGVPGNAVMVERVIVPLLDDSSRATVNFISYMNNLVRPTIDPPAGAAEIEVAFRTRAEQVQFGVSTPAQAARDLHADCIAIRVRAAR
jgi:multiple sugar transport system substrate-binding protein